MSVANHFHFIGVCYGDCQITKADSGKVIARFTLSIDNKTYIPVIAYGLDADRATYKCRSGNKLAVSGEVKTAQKLNTKTGLLEMKIYFISKGEMNLISMPKKKVISNKKPKTLTDIYCPDEHETLVDQGRKEENDE